MIGEGGVWSRGVEVEVRPPRLGLARVSVLRGEGQLSGQPCIDDYICATEPVYDYLTKYSGLVCPAQTSHWLLECPPACLTRDFLHC